VRILLIEDDANTGESIVRCLESVGYYVVVAADGPTGVEKGIAESYNLILLDVMLPGLDGFEVCRQLREAGIATPIIMITALDAIQDRVKGLEYGADDYLIKPFDFDELVARVKAQLRREGLHRTADIKIGPLEIKTEAHQVLYQENEIALTPREYQILEVLARNEGRVLSRDVLQTRVWGHDETVPNVVDVHIMGLRRKLEQHGAKSLIHTIRGFGYSLRRPAEE